MLIIIRQPLRLSCALIYSLSRMRTLPKLSEYKYRKEGIMRRLLIIIALIFGLLMASNGQSWVKKSGNPIIYTMLDGTDTLSASNDTITAELPMIIGSYSYSVQVIGDSISGSPDGTIALQTSNSVDVWETISSGTHTINGVTTNKTWSASTVWPGSRMRLLITGSGTQAVRMRAWATLKKIY